MMIAAICVVPLLCEALDGALEGIADVQSFPAGRGDTLGLLESVQPDAVVVDSDEEARNAERYAISSNVPVVHVQLIKQTLRILRDGVWEESPGNASPESIRNVLVGSLYGPRTVTA